jgi:glycosyltransferase involved in cell wall biosynthesis
MLMGKPVVVSDCPPLVRVVKGAQCGLVFQSGDPGSLAQAIISLSEDAARARLGANGKRAATSEYTWQRSAETLVALYRRLLAGDDAGD